MYTVTKYATMYHELGPLNNENSVVAWNNISNALKDTSGYSDCTLPKGTVAQNLFFHGFEYNLPTQYSVKTVTVEYSIRKTGKGQLKNPVCYFSSDNFKTSDIGHRSDLIINDDQHQLGEQFETIKFSFDGSFIKKISDSTGIALIFKSNDSQEIGTYEIDYIKITINYDAPQLLFTPHAPLANSKLEAEIPLPTSPYCKENNQEITLHFTIIPNKMSEEAIVDMDLPYSFDIRSGWVVSGDDSYYDSVNKKFHIKGKSLYVDCYLKIWAYNTGIFNLKFNNTAYMGTHDTWIKITGKDQPIPLTVWKCIGSIGESVQYEYVTASFHAIINTNNTSESFEITHNNVQASDPSCLAKDQTITLNTVLTSKGVTQVPNNDSLELIIDATQLNKDLDIYFDITFIMTASILNNIKIYRGTIGIDPYTLDYKTNHATTKIIQSTHTPLEIKDHRSVTTGKSGSYHYQCTFDYYDSHWKVKKSTLKMKLFTGLDYIGPVVLKHGHYKPTNNTKDNLLKTDSKNYRYLGKEGVTDETISLNIKLPPKDVVTLQGLVKLDMPVPINTCTGCFEGDPLNHRGWVELYSISNINRTNSKWYDCDIGVSYLTHNLNTRFNVVKGSLISKYFLPSNFKDTVVYGDNLTDYFELIPLNGHYIETTNPLRRNMFVLNNKEEAKILSRNKLNSKCEIDFNWDTIKLNTLMYNNMSRIVKIIDENNNSVFEYEWFDFNFNTSGIVECNVIARVRNKGAYDIILNRTINCHFGTEKQQEGEVITYIDTYGSLLRLNLDNNILSITDEGASGKELYLDNIELEGNNYRIMTEFKNTNTSHTQSIINYLSYHIQELEATDSSSGTYKDLIVSPFPIIDKQLMYVRESEDGLLYYFHNDDSEATFMMSPFFMYQCGVDLQTKEGASIIDLDNSYQAVYIVNGIVKIGLNRYNGIITIYKYNTLSRKYEEVDRYQLTKYDDILIQNYSYDKIQIKVSDTLISVWRGRPYIQIEHPTEDILYLNDYESVYAEVMGAYSYDNPHIIPLQDNTNLLPICVGSDRKIKADCIKYLGDELYTNDTEITITGASSCGLNNEYTVTYNCNNMIDSNASILINGVVIKDNLELNKSGSGTFKMKFPNFGTNKLQIFVPKTQLGDYGLSNTLNVSVQDDGYLIKNTTSKTLDYYTGAFTAKLTYAGNPASNETVWIKVNGMDYEKTTNSEGIASLNNHLNPGEYTVQFSYTDDDGNKYVTSEIITINPITLEPYNAVSNSDDTPAGSAFEKKEIINIKKGQTLHTIFYKDSSKTEYPTFKDELVVFEINGMLYTRYCNYRGACLLHINLIPGTYDLKILHGASNRFNEVNKHIELIVTE